MKKSILIIGIITLLASCNRGKDYTEIECEMKGGIILNKHDFKDMTGEVFYDVKFNGDIIPVKVYPLDSHYNLGDTIKGNCLGKVD